MASSTCPPPVVGDLAPSRSAVCRIFLPNIPVLVHPKSWTRWHTCRCSSSCISCLRPIIIPNFHINITTCGRVYITAYHFSIRFASWSYLIASHHLLPGCRTYGNGKPNALLSFANTYPTVRRCYQCHPRSLTASIIYQVTTALYKLILFASSFFCYPERVLTTTAVELVYFSPRINSITWWFRFDAIYYISISR